MWCSSSWRQRLKLKGLEVPANLHESCATTTECPVVVLGDMGLELRHRSQFVARHPCRRLSLRVAYSLYPCLLVETTVQAHDPFVFFCLLVAGMIPDQDLKFCVLQVLSAPVCNPCKLLPRKCVLTDISFSPRPMYSP